MIVAESNPRKNFIKKVFQLILYYLRGVKNTLQVEHWEIDFLAQMGPNWAKFSNITK